MNAPRDLNLSKDEFDRWITRQSGRRNEDEALASMQTYAVVRHAEALAWVRHRPADTGVFPARPSGEMAGDDQSLAIPGLGISLPLAELYQSTKLPIKPR